MTDQVKVENSNIDSELTADIQDLLKSTRAQLAEDKLKQLRELLHV
jgi:hypothetical protein